MNTKKKNHNKVYIYYINDLNKLHKNINEVVLSLGSSPINLNKIPESVTTLKFNNYFKNLPNEIPKNIINLYFYEFTNFLEELPFNVENVIIYKGFNNSVDNLGDNFKSIDFGLDFNNIVDNLPKSLEKVVFHFKFTNSINNLPSNIKFIHIINPDYDFINIKKLPKSIILLQLGLNDDLDDNLNNYFKLCLNNKKCILQPLEKNINISSKYLKNIYFYKE